MKIIKKINYSSNFTTVQDEGPIYAKPFIYDVVPYVGGDVTPIGMVRNIGLSSNENPFGCSPKVKNVLIQNFDLSWQYPCSSAQDLRAAIASHYNLNVNRILCGNGSEELLYLLAHCFVDEGDEVLIPEYAFHVFNVATLGCGGKIVKIPRNDDLTLNIQAINSLLTPKTKVLFLDHPGNPIGRYIPGVHLKRLIESIPPSVLVVLDAAYAEYMVGVPDYIDGIDWVLEHKNLIVTRTFSKVYGLAGLRLGWLYGAENLIEPLNKIRPPFNANRLAQTAGIAALQDQDFVKNTISHTNDCRVWLEQELKKLEYSILDCYTNFVMMDVGDKAKEIYYYLGNKGIIVRNLDAYGLNNYLRISIGTWDQMRTFINALKEYGSN